MELCFLCCWVYLLTGFFCVHFVASFKWEAQTPISALRSGLSFQCPPKMRVDFFINSLGFCPETKPATIVSAQKSLTILVGHANG